MDAFEACITRDLRKKYKIVFFNQQGLEEEGVDGGGIIKEFINRVLKYILTYSGQPSAKPTLSSCRLPSIKLFPIPTQTALNNINLWANWWEKLFIKASTLNKNLPNLSSICSLGDTTPSKISNTLTLTSTAA